MRRKVSEVLRRFDYPIESVGNFVRFRCCTRENDKNIWQTYEVSDKPTIEVAYDGNYMVAGFVNGCNVGISCSIPREAAYSVEERKVYCLKAVLLRMLMDSLTATDFIQYEVQEFPYEIVVKVGVKCSSLSE